MAVAHYLEALDWQRDFIKIHAILGGKNPHPQSFLVGGMAVPIDPNEQASLNVGTMEQVRQLIRGARDLVSKVYIPDVLAVAPSYLDWAGTGEPTGHYLVYGEYPETADPSRQRLLPRRRDPQSGDLVARRAAGSGKITEYVTHSWYTTRAATTGAVHPSEGETSPKLHGPRAALRPA